MLGRKQNTISPYSQEAGLAFMYSRNFAVIALLFLILYSTGEATKFYVFLSILGITTVIAFASFAAGGIIGFLFGIPHANPNNKTYTAIVTPPHASNNNTPNAASTNAASAQNNPASGNASSTPVQPTRFTENRAPDFIQSTNLEQIADWLTKIFVGVGLTQIHKIIALFNSLCLSLGRSVEVLIPHAQHPHAAPLIGGIVILFALDGFLIVYLWTYLYLLKIQDEMSKTISDTIDYKLRSIDSNDKIAIDLANTQLDLPQNAADIPIDDLVNAFANASKNVISTIFFKVVSVRKQNWRIEDNRVRINRTIPIFKALVKLDSNFEYPENFAELGYALKDKNPPNYKEALDAFDKAIESFKVNKKINKPITFYNRAYCRISVDENFLKEDPQPTSEESKKAIAADLDEAAKDVHVAEIMKEDDVIQKWKSVNGLN